MRPQSEWVMGEALGIVYKELARHVPLLDDPAELESIANGELFDAALAYAIALDAKKREGTSAFYHKENNGVYPENWNGLRDYGSDIANLAVIASLIIQEIRRKLILGEDTTRTERESVG